MTAATVKAGLVTVLTAKFAADGNVLVSYGTPGPTAVPDIVAVRDVSARPDGEEETFDIEVVVSCYVGGASAAQSTATARAYSLLADINTALNAAPTLSASCRVAILDFDHRLAETVAYDATGQVAVGRLSEIVASVTAWSGRPLLGDLASAHPVP